MEIVDTDNRDSYGTHRIAYALEDKAFSGPPPGPKETVKCAGRYVSIMMCLKYGSQFHLTEFCSKLTEHQRSFFAGNNEQAEAMIKHDVFELWITVTPDKLCSKLTKHQRCFFAGINNQSEATLFKYQEYVNGGTEEDSSIN